MPTGEDVVAECATIEFVEKEALDRFWAEAR